MRCLRCGADTDLGAAYCGSCGAAIPISNTVVMTEIPPDAAPAPQAQRLDVVAPPRAPGPHPEEPRVREPRVHESRVQESRAEEPRVQEQGRPLGAPPTPPAARHSAAPMSDATRYLCTGVHLDSAFGERFIRNVLDEDFKAAPFSPGVDLPVLAAHALAARRRHRIRDVLLLVAVAVLIVGALRVSFWLLVLGVLLAWATVLGETLVATYSVVARRLSPGSEAAPPKSSLRQHTRQRLASMSAEGNVTVYGSFNPFVGSGVPLNAWSFVLSLTGADGKQSKTFSSLELHDELKARLTALTLPGTSIEDRAFVDGQALREDRRFLSQELSAPTRSVDPSLLRSLISNPEDRARTYLCVRVTGWRDQLVLSTFVRAVRTGDKLFVELSYSLLTPVIERFQVCDFLLPQPTGRQFAGLAWRSLKAVPRAVLSSPAAAGRALWSPVSDGFREARTQREITSGLRYNYGATVNPRESAADRNCQRYFQLLDKDYYLKVVEKAILNGLLDFLEARGFDTNELVQRQTAITNFGTWISGGTVTADSMAAGAGAVAQSDRRSFGTQVRGSTGGKS